MQLGDTKWLSLGPRLQRCCFKDKGTLNITGNEIFYMRQKVKFRAYSIFRDL